VIIKGEIIRAWKTRKGHDMIQVLCRNGKGSSDVITLMCPDHSVYKTGETKEIDAKFNFGYIN
jgi:hypothetical protein